MEHISFRDLTPEVIEKCTYFKTDEKGIIHLVFDKAVFQRLKMEQNMIKSVKKKPVK
jgi:acyl CoA:acetate/3-ketoacid CoA transferase beta subunit